MESKTSLTFNMNENHLKKAQNFFSKYDLVSMLGGSRKNILGSEENRICRFCKKGTLEVKFKKDAHVIPEFMGNHNLLSYFECDACNELFAKYEDSFANLIGISRTISQIEGKKNKIPKYKDPQTGLEMIVNDLGIQLTSLVSHEAFNIDRESKKLIIKTTRPGYIPIHIPKIFIKIGFCMLLDDELSDFETTRKFIINTKNEDRFLDCNLLRIFGYSIPGPPIHTKPFIQLYRKKLDSKSDDIPLYQLILYYANYQFQMTLPFGKEDESLEGKKVNLPIAPFLIDNSYLEKIGPEHFLDLNLTSAEKKTKEDHIITFSYKSIEIYPENPGTDVPQDHP